MKVSPIVAPQGGDDVYYAPMVAPRHSRVARGSRQGARRARRGGGQRSSTDLFLSHISVRLSKRHCAGRSRFPLVFPTSRVRTTGTRACLYPRARCVSRTCAWSIQTRRYLAATGRGSIRLGIWMRIVRLRCRTVGKWDTGRMGLGGARALEDTLQKTRWGSTLQGCFGRCDLSVLKVCKLS